jgi:hypothetical protein
MILGDFTNIFYWLIKGMFVISSLLYLIFATIVVRQTYQMTSKIYDMFNTILIIIAWVHFVISILLVLLVLLV